jgi:class 3 adenylate cyclase/tetratricopeptide (TPR) repeat protein
MRCPRCESDNPDGTKFCIECGMSLRPRCPRCGADTLPRARFCGECGTALTGQLPAPPSAYPRPPLSDIPRHVAENILISRRVVEGERKQVTVLFADLKGSMELLADRDPEEARQLLDPVLERMMEAVHHYEGTVNQVLGDGIMALFGAPIAHEDHVMRACYAALRMQDTVTRYSAELQRTQGVSMHIRVGLNAGEVVVRGIDSSLHMDYTAVGQTTHLAARMEQMAMPGSILITAEVLRLAEGYIQVQPLGLLHVKGLSEPTEVYRVIGAGPARTRLQAAAARGLTPFVGREPELAILRQVLARVEAGQGQVVGLVGEPGVGRSRLIYEFAQAHRTCGWLRLEGCAVSYGRATPYLPVIELLKAYFQLEERDDLGQIRDKLTAKLLGLDAALGPMLPALLALLDVPVEDPQWQALEPQERRRRTLDAVKRLLLRASRLQPLLLVFEDLHWVDTETEVLLDALVESLPAARLLLLLSYRPEYRHSWGGKTYYTQLRLDPLSPDSAAALLQALFGDNPSLEPLTRRLIRRTEGNPLFLEESVRTLIEMRVLVGERGAYRLAQVRRRASLQEGPELVGEQAAYHLRRATESIQVPATVRAVLAARIDRLPEEEKDLLQTAAVIGVEVPFALLQAIAGRPTEELRRPLQYLQAAEFLYEAEMFPEPIYTFKHALTHEVAYGSLLQVRRRALHARIVAAIEQLYADHLADQTERLAHHAFQGEAWEKAVSYFRQAAVKATSRAAAREAVACLEQALVALGHLPECRETLEQAIDLRLDLRTALRPLGEHDRVLASLCEAEALAAALGDQRQLGRVSAYLSRHFSTMGDQERALVSGHRALALAEATGDAALRIMATLTLGVVYHALGDYRRAIDLLRPNLASLKDAQVRGHFGMAGPLSHSPGLLTSSQTWLAFCLAEVGAFAEGITIGEEGVRAAEAVDQPSSLAVAYAGVGRPYLSKGNFRHAIPVFERGVTLCRDGNIWDWFPTLAGSLGYAYALSGRITEGLSLLEAAVKQTVSGRTMARYVRYAAWLGEAYLLTDRLEDAIQVAQRALELSGEHKRRGDQAWALRLLGEIAVYRDPPAVEQAETHYRQALTLADELGMRPLQAHCHLGLGKLYIKMGRRDDARAELRSAIALYRAMEMTLWLPRAEATLAQVAGVEET